MKIRVADYIANFLAENDITQIFTVTGGGAMHLNDALGKNNGLHCTYNHHEQACAIAAESYARLSGKIAAVCVTSGPGGTNAITGVLGGWLDSIPMLVISGQVKFETTVRSTDLPLRQLGDQEFDITACVKTMTKYAEMITDPNKIRYHLEKALYLAEHGRKGPCWLDVPLNVQGALIDTENLCGYDSKREGLEHIPEISDDVVIDVIEKLKSAERPVIFAGSAIRSSGAEKAFYELIERFNIPVVTAWNAHDILWDTHPLSFGRPGTVGNRAGNFIVQNADVLLVLGSRLNIRQISYNWENFAESAYQIMVDIDENELKKPTLSLDMPIHGNVAEFMEKMLKTNQSIEPKEQWIAYCQKVKRKYPAVREEHRKRLSPINPYVFIDELTKSLPEGQIVVCGNGSACVCTFQAANIKRGQRLYTNSGCASMGYDVPAAIGAYQASREKIVCLAGDGSLQMNIQELQTIRYNNMNIIIFVLNNDGYHSIRQTQGSFFGLPLVGVNQESGVGFPNLNKIADAYEMPYYKLETTEKMDAVLKEILSHDGPALCEVLLDPEQAFEPKLSSRKLEDGTMISPSLEDMYPFLDREEFEENMIKGSKNEREKL
ncbi:thiamine pyrophosphate-binding protein [Christensenella tenuis]|uniref:thiamine pyrophosphate-binding protein n=1 Tax=Christensenella tenuis TaxID=2763033 RepID=UPI002ED3E462